MPRTKRLVPTDAAMHIMCRGNNKLAILADNSDKAGYYYLLLKFKAENHIDIFHYCIMDNHVHLIAGLNSHSKLSRFMKQVNLTYSYHYSKRYGYCGHLWQGRFKSVIIEKDEHALQCGKYIELNPVRAVAVASASQYLFSSYNYYSLGSADELITDNPAYLSLSDSPEIRRRNYTCFVSADEIADSLQRGPLFIGNPVFVNTLERFYGVINMSKMGRPRLE